MPHRPLGVGALLEVRVGPQQRTRIGYDRTNGTLFLDRAHSGAPVNDAFGGAQTAPVT